MWMVPLCCVLMSSAVAADAGLEITVAPKKPVFAQGDKLAFTVTAKNISQKTLRVKEIVHAVGNSFVGEKFTYVAGEGGRGKGPFQENVGLYMRLASARGRGAPPPGRDVPSEELAPGKAATFDFDFESGSMEYAIIQMDLVRVSKSLPAGSYTATFTFRFPPPLDFNGRNFVEKPNPAFFTGDVKGKEVKFEVAK